MEKLETRRQKCNYDTFSYCSEGSENGGKWFESPYNDMLCADLMLCKYRVYSKSSRLYPTLPRGISLHIQYCGLVMHKCIGRERCELVEKGQAVNSKQTPSPLILSL